MGIDTARRAQDQVREGLAELIRLVNDPATPTAEVREVLSGSKAFGVQVSVLQADAAVVVAARERHGDCGVGVLAQAAGLSRQQAVGQVQTAQSLQSMPAVRDAVESGKISVANAKTLARASGRTSASQVDADAELLAKAAELSPEQFATEAGRWAIKRQDDGGENEYRRQRARRRLSFWDGDDGMVHLRGELDPVTGAKVRKRFVQESERLRRADLHSPGGDKRSLSQRMADSLDTLTSHGSIYSKAEDATSVRGNSNHPRTRSNDADRKDFDDADREGAGAGGGRGGGGVDREDVGGAYGNESGAGGTRDHESGAGGTNGEGGDGSSADREGGDRVGGDRVGGVRTGGNESGVGGAYGEGAGGGGVDREGGKRGKCGCGRRPSADITIVQHLSADGTEAFAEVAGGEVIPPSVLEEYFCDARIMGVVFSGEGVPLWHGHAKRTVTKAQMNALRARYGACGGCGADMWICQGHHIRPVSEGGPTNIDNMMLLCWACHQKVHHHGWRAVPDGRGLYTIAPPERIHHGPARAPDLPPGHAGPPTAASHHRSRTVAGASDRADPAARPPMHAAPPRPLFALD